MSTRLRVIMTDAVGTSYYGRTVERKLDNWFLDYGYRIPKTLPEAKTKERITTKFNTLKAKFPDGTLLGTLQFVREPKRLRPKKSLYVQTLINAGAMLEGKKEKEKLTPRVGTRNPFIPDPNALERTLRRAQANTTVRRTAPWPLEWPADVPAWGEEIP